ncbi:hypothetical protein AVDCRST_MAG81-5290 [uncultured Synechococcales cyanobacterium]|uniref:Uncharacterized protein n=1 Tax=uncultured Synechococcales cyanobacterium TaxID=1936017 RepID=A0A6J4VYI1_9CYAN|nr:hypothetical protein AVDCRST_MAG81-5290 [uncultured Synechococcales cyanobacterium]
MKATFRHSWASKPDEAQLSDKSKKCKAPPHPKRHKRNDYRAQNVTIDVVAELLEVEPLRIQRS